MDEANASATRGHHRSRQEIALGTPRELIASTCAEQMVEFTAGSASKTLDVPALRRIEASATFRTENGAVLLQVTELHTSVPACSRN